MPRYASRGKSRLPLFEWQCPDGVTPATQFPGDTDFPYVGKYIANLTLAQLRTVDCGSKRQYGYREFVFDGSEAGADVLSGHTSRSDAVDFPGHADIHYAGGLRLRGVRGSRASGSLEYRVQNRCAVSE